MLDLDQIQNLAAGFLPRFAVGDFFGGFAFFNRSGHNFQQPGPLRLQNRADPELFDDDDFVAVGVVQQHRHAIAAAEQFPR